MHSVRRKETTDAIASRWLAKRTLPKDQMGSTPGDLQYAYHASCASELAHKNLTLTSRV